MSDRNADTYGLSPETSQAAVAAPQLQYQPPKPRNPTRPIALIGCGGIAGHHLAAYRGAGFNVRALCDLDIEKARTRQQQYFPDAICLADYRSVLEIPEIEVLDIATHPSQRNEILEAAINAGKNILSQKPFAEDLETAVRLATLAEERGVKLAVNQNGRWAPHFRWMISAVRAGLLGSIGMINFDLHFDHSWTAGTSFDEVEDLILYDFGIHWFDIARCLLPGSRPLRVAAVKSCAPGQKPRPPMLASVIIELSDSLVTLNFDGMSRSLPEDRTRICGSKAEILSFGPSLSKQEILFSSAEGQAEVKLEGTWFSEGFQGSMAELLLAIDENRAPESSARDNLSTLALCFAAIKASQSGCWEAVSDPAGAMMRSEPVN